MTDDVMRGLQEQVKAAKTVKAELVQRDGEEAAAMVCEPSSFLLVVSI